MQFFGVDLAWGEGSPGREARESGLALIDETGRVLEAGWARGIDAVADWLVDLAEPGAVVAIDAPLVVHNAPKTMRDCEREVAIRYGRSGFSAYPTHPETAWLGGVTLRTALESRGFTYTDGTTRPDLRAITMFECYPNTTIVGMPELGYDTGKPKYKGRTKQLSAIESRAARAAACDELLRRLDALGEADPPLDLRSHEVTERLLSQPSPLLDAPFKHREDLLDASICAWTASIWHRHGDERVLILGRDSQPDDQGRRATIVAPARPEHRNPSPTARSRTSAGTPARRAIAALRAVPEMTSDEIDAVRAEVDRLTTQP